MKRIRSLLALAVLIAGIAVLSTSNAADVGNDEFKILIDQDSKLITKALAAVAKAKKPAADLQKAFSAVNASCTACHNVFK